MAVHKSAIVAIVIDARYIDSRQTSASISTAVVTVHLR